MPSHGQAMPWSPQEAVALAHRVDVLAGPYTPNALLPHVRPCSWSSSAASIGVAGRLTGPPAPGRRRGPGPGASPRALSLLLREPRLASCCRDVGLLVAQAPGVPPAHSQKVSSWEKGHLLGISTRVPQSAPAPDSSHPTSPTPSTTAGRRRGTRAVPYSSAPHERPARACRCYRPLSRASFRDNRGRRPRVAEVGVRGPPRSSA